MNSCSTELPLSNKELSAVNQVSSVWDHYIGKTGATTSISLPLAHWMTRHSGSRLCRVGSKRRSCAPAGRKWCWKRCVAARLIHKRSPCVVHKYTFLESELRCPAAADLLKASCLGMREGRVHWR